MSDLGKALEPIIKQTVSDELDKHDIDGKVKEAIAGIAMNSVKTIEVVNNGGEPINVGIQHKEFEKLVKLISAGFNLMITGQAGSGKTHGVESACNALGLDFGALSIGKQTTKTDILGFVDANGIYRTTAFRERFEHGGVFLMDEIDAGNPNVLIQINSAISNGFCEFPDNGEVIRAHKDFRFVSTANTYGTGANAKYVGRNQLDSATLDRFTAIEWNVDEELEAILTNNDAWHNAILEMRKYADVNYDAVMITQRSSIKGAQLLALDFSLDDTMKMQVLKGFDDDICDALMKIAKKHYKKPEPKVAEITEPEPETESKWQQQSTTEPLTEEEKETTASATAGYEEQKKNSNYTW